MQDLLKEPCWQLIIIGVKFTHSFLSNECFFFPHCTFLVFFPLSAENTRHGPVFTQEPSDSIFPMSTDDKQVFINCKAKGNPPPRYR